MYRYIWLVPLLPLLGAAVNGLLGRRFRFSERVVGAVGVGSVVATSLVPEDKKASAIAVMFTGLTIATLLGVPAGTWLGLFCAGPTRASPLCLAGSSLGRQRVWARIRQ